jgi:thioredoxin-like negative regulator of GroEL
MVKGVRVTKIPTVVLYKNAEPVGKLEGLFDETKFDEFIQTHTSAANVD